ncbi:MAG: hypothetical protein QW189_07770 [Thermofilaceae archaeon]
MSEVANVESRRIEAFRKKVIEWYRRNGDQSLPWRSSSDPWLVLIAAFLLRKTTTKQVVAVYRRFIERYPSPSELSKADAGSVEDLIRPLGIERQRAKHLVELANYIVENFGGTVPCSREKLKKLPGVGDYTASEVLLVACSQPEPLLDRNMVRVLERVLCAKSSKPRPHTDPHLWKIAREIVPSDIQEARAFNFGVLDLARKICKAGKPKCLACPLSDICACHGEKTAR